MVKKNLRDIGRALDEQLNESARADRDRLEDVLFPRLEPAAVWSERGWEGVYARLTEIRAAADEHGTLTAEEQADLDRIGEEIVTAIRPILDAFQKMVEIVSESLHEFFSGPVWVDMVNLSMAMKEPEDQIDTVEVVDTAGNTVATHIINPPPIAARSVGIDPVDPVEPVGINPYPIPHKDPYHNPIHMWER